MKAITKKIFIILFIPSFFFINYFWAWCPLDLTLKVKKVRAAGTTGGVYIARAPDTNLITNLGSIEQTLTYDTEVKPSDNISRQTGNQAFRIQNSGRYLIIANTRFDYQDLGSNNRHVVRTQIKIGGTVLPSIYGMASGYGRDSGSADEDGAVVAAYIDHTVSGDPSDDITIHVQNFGDTAVSVADQLTNQSGIQIVRLPDDSDYLKVRRTTDINFGGTMDYSTNDPTYNDFGFETQDIETDTDVIEWVAGSAGYGAYVTEVLSDTPFYTYILNETSLINIAGSYAGGANGGGTLVGDGLIEEFDDALEGTAFEITTSNDTAINLATTTASETIEVIVRIDDTSSLQTIYEQGGGSRGLSLSISGGNLYFSGWNNVTSDGPGDAWGATGDHLYASVAIGGTGTYYVAGVYVQESGDDNYDGELRVYIGDVTDTASGLTSDTTVGVGSTGPGAIGKLYAHSGDAHWAENADAFIGPSGVTTAPSNLDGALNAISLYDGELSSTQLGDHFAASDDEGSPVVPNPDTITLKETGHYMVIYSIKTYSDAARKGSTYRLRIGDTEVPASRVVSYVRDNDGDTDSWVQWAGIIEATADDILNIDWASASELAGGKLEEAVMTVVRLPDSADYVRVRYDANRAGETTGAYPFNQEDEDDDVHDNITNNSRISGNADDHDWLLFSSWFLRNSTADDTRTSEHFRWHRTGSEVYYGSGLSFTRGDQSTAGVPAGGRNAIIVASALGAGEYMELNMRLESGVGDQSRDFIANRAGITGVALDTLIPAVSVSISISTDGSVAFQTLALESTEDTTATGINDVETVSVDTGPADLNVRSTNFTEGSNIWTLNTTNGSNQVHWEFSEDSAAWTTFALADTLYTLDTNVAQGQTRDLYLRLTTPTLTDSYDQYSSTVTVVASVP